MCILNFCLYHFAQFWCVLSPKTAKTGEKGVFFWCKKRVFWCFLMKNEAKSVFFEAFLGLKMAFLVFL